MNVSELNVSVAKLIKTAKITGFYDGLIAAQKTIIAALPEDEELAYRIVKALIKEKSPEE